MSDQDFPGGRRRRREGDGEETGVLLLESGDRILLENGDFIRREG